MTFASEWREPPNADATTNGARTEVEPLFTFYTATEFDALDLRREYHVPGILAGGPVPTVLAGSFKTLKTSIAVDLLYSLATGSAFLGYFPVSEPINVAVMSGESGGYALQNLLRRVAKGRGRLVSEPGERLRICTAVPGLSRAADMEGIERVVAEHDIGVLAIDPTYLAMCGLRADDAGNLFAVGALLKPLTELAERTGVTPIVVHHNSRGATRANAGEPAELADIAWSGFSEWAGQWILLSRRERYDPDSDGFHALWLTAGGRDGHSTLVGVNVTEGRQDDPGGRRWSVEVENASAARAAAQDAEQDRREAAKQRRQEKQLVADADAIVAVLKGEPEGMTKRRWRDTSGIRTQRFDAALAAVLAAGVAEPTEIVGGNNRVYEGYRIAAGRNGTQRDAHDASR